jgi:hypothetical protein
VLSTRRGLVEREGAMPGDAKCGLGLKSKKNAGR